MRTITVNSESFSVLYGGMLGAEGFKGAEARLASRVMGKFEDAGKFDPDTKLYGLENGTATIKLEDAEYDLLSRCLESAVWRPQFVRQAIKIIDWFKSVEPDE